MSKQLSFIHAADLHLDSPFNGLAHIPEAIFKDVRESTFMALDHLVQAAIERKVDFILMVGDLFDHENQSLKAQMRLRRAFETLKKHQIYVYLSYGNHDHIHGNKHRVSYPDNVFIFQSEEVSSFIYEKENIPMAEIHGFSYENRAVLENKVPAYQMNDQSLPFHIAMLHGSLKSNTVHDTYAPFQMNDLDEKDFDYWALGHIHQREVLQHDPPVVYSGNIQGRHRKESGMKGCYHVMLTPENTSLDFIPLQAIQFKPLMIDVSACNEIHQLEMEIIERLDAEKAMTAQLIDLTLTSDQSNLSAWKNNFAIDDVIDLINDIAIQKQNWQYIFRFTVNIKHSIYDGFQHQGDYFIAELSRQFDELSIQPYIKELFRHRQGRKYLEILSEEKEDSIKEEARQLLYYELLNNGGE